MLDLLRQRRSIRKFRDQQIESDKQKLLMEAALRSPSSRGRNPWEFIQVTDPDLLAALGSSKQHGSAFLADAPMAVVIAADPEKCDVWVEDCSIAAIILQLTAVSLGLGSCWVQIRLRPHDEGSSAESYIKEILNLPDNLVVGCVIAIGYPDEEKPGHADESLLRTQVHSNRFTVS